MSSSTTLTSSRFTTRVTQNNPSGMTLEGTNTYVLAAPGADTVVIVDPGFGEGAADHAAQVAKVVGERKVELILITNYHLDLIGAVDTFDYGIGELVHTVAEQWCRQAASLIADGIIMAAVTHILVLATPGHTSDSVAFFLFDGGAVPDPGGTV